MITSLLIDWTKVLFIVVHILQSHITRSGDVEAREDEYAVSAQFEPILDDVLADSGERLATVMSDHKNIDEDCKRDSPEGKG